jgi:hypothetical protein
MLDNNTILIYVKNYFLKAVDKLIENLFNAEIIKKVSVLDVKKLIRIINNV